MTRGPSPLLMRGALERHPARRVALFVVLGVLTPIVFILGAAPFEVRGRDSVAEVAAGSVVVALYVAVCHIVQARRRGAGARVDWPTVIAMLSAIVVTALAIVAVEGAHIWWVQMAPMVSAGALGTIVGVWAGVRGARSAT